MDDQDKTVRLLRKSSEAEVGAAFTDYRPGEFKMLRVA